MKLTKSQKKILKSIPNEKTRLEQKLQFKIQNKFESEKAIVFESYKDHKKVEFPDGGIVYVKKWKLLEQPENHNSTFKTGVIYKGKLFDTIEEALGHDFKEKPNQILNRGEKTARGLSDERIDEIHKNWMGLANIDFNIKGNEIISDEKAKEIYLNNEYLQKVLSETHDVKLLRDLQNICVKCQNYEYASKFRQKVRDVLGTLNVEKLMELVQNGTVELSDMIHAVGRQKIKFDTNDHTYHISENNHLCWIYNRLINYGENPNVDYMHKLKEIALNFSAEKQFTLEDMRKIYVNGILDNQNLLVTPETCQITFDMHLRNVEKKQ